MISSLIDLSRQRQRVLWGSIAAVVLFMFWSSVMFPGQTKPIRHAIQPYTKSFLNVPATDDLSIRNMSHIARHVGTPTFEYAHRRIKTQYTTAGEDRPSLTVIDAPLLPEFQLLEKNNLTRVPLANLPILTLNVPSSALFDTSIFSFGISTKLNRLKYALPQLQHWLPNSNARLHVSIPAEHSPSISYDIQEMETTYHSAGVNLTLHVSELSFAKSYFSLIKTLYENRTPQAKWLVLIDDDTFIPSLPHLAQHFAKLYDPTTEIMVATLSDNLNQVNQLGQIPFGGGGIFFSIPLAESFLKEEVWEACLAVPNDQGDQVVNECLDAHSSVRPTFDNGLNQMDIKGDASGYFESGRRMLTVHHWRTWYNVDVPLAANVSKACGFECVFQRWKFADDFVLSNGFSVVDYVNGVDEGGVELEKVEKTWDGELWVFRHHIGPLRLPMPKAEKRTARLVEANVVDGIGVRQVYVERMKSGSNGERADGDVDRVVELLWLF